jgi:hypothetical protein
MISGTRSPHENKAGRRPYLGGSFLVLPFNSPRRTKLSAVATMDSWFDRGAQPGMRLGFSLVAFFIWPSIYFTAGGSTAPVRYGSQATIHLSRRGSRQSRLLCVPPRTQCLRAVLYSGGRVLSRCGQVWSG